MFSCHHVSQITVSALRTTSQAGSVTSGPGGSANAVNGLYIQAAVDAAVAAADAAAVTAGLNNSSSNGGAGLYFGSATTVVSGPWWAVDLGAAMPLAFVEVTAHPTPSDGQGLQVSSQGAAGVCAT